MNFKKIKVSETRNAIINLDLLVGIFYEPTTYEYPNAPMRTILRFANDYEIVIPYDQVKSVLESLGLDNV